MNRYAFFILILIFSSCDRTSGDEFLSRVDETSSIELIRRNDRCGEWGGDIEIISIYRKGVKGLYADYSINTSACDHPELSIDSTKIFQKRGQLLDEKTEELVNESIGQLIKASKASSDEIYFGHAGIRNRVIISDSSLIIDDYPSIQWRTFERLVKEILK